MKSKFLYRGVSKRFHDLNNRLLKPKVQGEFTYAFLWEETDLPWSGGVTWASTPTNAVIRHQLNQEGFPTSGISTTPHLERAVFYAKGSSGVEKGFVFKFDKEVLRRNGFSLFVVSEYCIPSIPEDDEEIVVCPEAACIPQEVISAIFEI